MRQALEKNYFVGVLDGYLDTEEGKNSLADHTAGRYQIAADQVMPWLHRKFDLSERTVIEIGSGTGSSTLALAQVARSVECYELNQYATAVARERLDFWGITNVHFHSTLFDEKCELVQSGGTATAIMLYAALEHMTHEECLAILALSWRILRPGGILVIAETPNRFSFVDEHTSLLPFFSQLPREIQVRYAVRSPRDDFRWAIAEAGREGHEKALEAMTRWGSGISYHEFELGIGQDVHQFVVLDGYEPEITNIVPVSEIDTILQTVFKQFGVQAHRAFTRRSLYLVLQKP
jgi:ubiquinone/menaquinone biosynthesis C-methylase UbiE